MISESRKNRKIHMDIIRIVAIFLVIFNHTNEKGFFLFSITENAIMRPIYTTMSILCTVAVPLFFMVSGGLLLGKEESLTDLYRKRVLRIFGVIVIFSIFQEIFFVVFREREFLLSDFLETIIFSRIIIPYWYLYAYLAYLMILPFLRKLAQNLKNEEFIYLFVLFFTISGCLPYLSYFGGYNNINLSIPFFTTTIIYPLAGYFIEFKLKRIKKIICFWTISFISLIIMVLMTWKRAVDIGELSEYGNGLFITNLIGIVVFTIYYTVKYFCEKHVPGNKTTKIITFSSGTVFGIYLVEERIREASVGIDIVLAPIIGWLPACFIWILFVVFVSFIITTVLKQIPGLKKLL